MPHRIAILMGVAGSGKSVSGSALAERLGLPFRDADEFHPQANIDKQAAGIPLDDDDRRPWLAAIGAWLYEHRETGAIVTCSALKRQYRDQLRDASPGVPFLHLEGPEAVAATRVGSRPGHFMPASLVRSQYETLEPLQADEIGLVIDFTLPVDEIVDAFVAYLEVDDLPHHPVHYESRN